MITTNGIFRAIALIHGRAAGTWALGDGRVKLDVWNDPGVGVDAALASEAADVERYLAPSAGG